MPQAQSWNSRLFLSDLNGFHEIKNPRTSGIHVGIWWHNGNRLVGYAQLVSEIEGSGSLIDSNLTHANVWNIARRELSCPSEREYFAIPRGRVLWHTVRGLGILYHGNATSTETLRELARLFGLPQWEGHLDDHYLTGDALDELFCQEEG